jgi:allophanate hydrolase
VVADPVGANARLGRFTNFANLMDLAALALPGPEREDGLPAGVSLLARAFHDRRLLELGAAWHEECVDVMQTAAVRLAVVGAHLSGLSLNGELTSRGGRLVGATTTAPGYRLYALPAGDDGVRRAGLVHVVSGGMAVEAEVWELSSAALGDLMTHVPAPLGIGHVTLANGGDVLGLLCDAVEVECANDITAFGGWRAYVGAGHAG